MKKVKNAGGNYHFRKLEKCQKNNFKKSGRREIKEIRTEIGKIRAK